MKRPLLITITILLLIIAGYITIKFDGVSNFKSSEIISNNLETKNDESVNLGKYQCLSLIDVKRGGNNTINLKDSGLKTDFFESFPGGAFFGRIKNYNSDMKNRLYELINQLMLEEKIKTYEHLRARVCLYNKDLYNPPGGANLNYYVEHEYCTNECSVGKYLLHVTLNADGGFIGYRTDFEW